MVINTYITATCCMSLAVAHFFKSNHNNNRNNKTAKLHLINHKMSFAPRAFFLKVYEWMNGLASEWVSDLWISPRMNVGAPGSSCPWSNSFICNFCHPARSFANNINYQVAASVAPRLNHIKIWLINKNRQQQQLNKATTCRRTGPPGAWRAGPRSNGCIINTDVLLVFH